jgi:hypothetical protein
MSRRLVFICVLCHFGSRVRALGVDVDVVIDSSKNLTSLNLSASNSSVLSNATAGSFAEVVGIASCAQPPCLEPTLLQLVSQLSESYEPQPIPNATISITDGDNIWNRIYASNNHVNAILIGGGLILLCIFVVVVCCFHTYHGSRAQAHTRPRYRKVLAVQLVRVV